MQTWLVHAWASPRWGGRAGASLALLYVLTLLPSWWLFVRRRDLLRDRYATLRNAMLFLLHARPATQLQAERRRLQHEVRALLREYDRAGPRAA